jgi:UTP--glucose-1-phosphate uridylyltransferase
MVVEASCLVRTVFMSSYNRSAAKSVAIWDHASVQSRYAVDVVVIPCAGAGLRMRPATRSVPKPLLPVIDRPVIQYIVEEAIAAGITEVIFVVDEPSESPVLAHFIDPPMIEGTEHVTFMAVEQPEPRGLGDAVLRAAAAVRDRPFLCMVSDRFPVPGAWFAERLIAAYRGRPVVAVERVTQDVADRYGFVVVGDAGGGELVEVVGAVEKPGVGKAPSDLALLGRYVFPPSMFEDLAGLEPGHGGEIQLTDAIDAAARRRGAVGVLVDHVLLDTGTPVGLLEATAAVGLASPDLGPAFRRAMVRLLEG